MEPRVVVTGRIRSVLPYYHSYSTPFKERWRSHTVRHVLCAELGQTPEVVASGIEDGSIYVTTNNGKSQPKEEIRGAAVLHHRLQPHDVIHNRQHTHEPAVDVGEFGVGSGSRAIVHEDSHVMVVNKPGGVPTHPGGIYRHNSVTEMVRMGRCEVWPCHRLDKATSGVLVLAKSKAACVQYMAMLAQKHSVEKFYVARVRGRFPAGQLRYTFPVFSINSAGGYAQNSSVQTDSTTVFRCMQYWPHLDQSVVLCKPISGKMHQIRIHLRNLGHPIANDAFYNDSDEVNRLKGAIEMAIKNKIEAQFPGLGAFPVPKSHCISDHETEMGAALSEQKVYAAMQELEAGEISHVGPISVSPYVEELASQISALAELRKAKDSRAEGRSCTQCRRPLYEQAPDTGIFLHAALLRSRGHFSYTAPLPKWATAP